MNLYGIHDIEGHALAPRGGWCLALTKLLERPGGVDYDAINNQINWIVRLNWGYGSEGTIPHMHQMREYLDAVQHFVLGSSGVHTYIVGNEPNHEQERPGGINIDPEQYAEFYARTYKLIKGISTARVLVAPPAPYHANGKTWIVWYREVLKIIDQKGITPDGFSIHAYTRSSSPDAIHDIAEMGGVLSGTFSGFFTYRDSLSCIPPKWRGLPAYLTEFNPLLPHGWDDANTGMVRAMYREVNWWNNQNGTQKILCALLYRFPGHDKWGFENKPGVVSDFKDATQDAFQSPQAWQGEAKGGVLMPSIRKEDKNAPSPSTGFKRDIDQRALDRLVKVSEIPAGPAWRVKKIQWFNEAEADRVGPDHHILLDTLDENGNRVTGVKLQVIWPSGFHTVTSEAKPGELASANYPMSPSRNEFSVHVVDQGMKSEIVTGIGMGVDNGGGFNPGAHTTTLVVFQRSVTSEVKEPVTPPVQDAPVKINLVHPVENPKHRVVTQLFGVNEANYKRFKVDGVPLKGHNGIDYGTPIDSRIVAADTGEVIEQAFDQFGYGVYVKMRHNWGETLYAHLNHTGLRPGDVLMRGQLVGFSGNSGNSTGPHLHFGLRTNPYQRNDGWGGYKNPLPYLFKQQEAVTLPPTDHAEIVSIIKQVANEQGMDWRLLASLAWNESSFKAGVNYGLFQIEDPAWKDFSGGVGAKDRNNPLDNTRVGASYLKFLLERFGGNVWEAIIAYNMGFVAFERGDEVPYLTRTHAAKVTACYDLLKALGV